MYIQNEEKYNIFRDELITVEREIEHLLTKLKSVDGVRAIQGEIKELEIELQEEIERVAKQINESNDIYMSIRKDFKDFVMEILDNNAIIDMRMNRKNNIEFKASFLVLIMKKLHKEWDIHIKRYCVHVLIWQLLKIIRIDPFIDSYIMMDALSHWTPENKRNI